MTINIAVVTSDALVLGCDSVASVTTPMISPFATGFAKGKDGKAIKDENGNILIPMKNVEHVVTDVMGGVTKMFKIYDEKDIVVAAITSGLGKLNDRPIAAVAHDFSRSVGTPRRGKQKYSKVEDVVRGFYDFMRSEYETDQQGSHVPEDYWNSLSFLVGGLGKDDKFPCVWRVSLKDKTSECEFKEGKTGMCWGGQSDSIERLIRGYDGELRYGVEKYAKELLESHHKRMGENTVRILDEVLRKLNLPMPDGINSDLPPLPSFEPDWEQFKIGVSYSNLSLQEAINFVAFLVLTQEGKQKFAPGIATVGGRIHVGYATRASGFNLLNEPILTHNQTGFPYEH